jgi:PqqD family protein of HPr-rel-A system
MRPLLARHWDGEAVVYDAYSGETHYLAPVAARLFRQVDEAKSIAFDALCEGTKLEAPDTDPEAIDKALAELVHLKLLSTVEEPD